jgi:hypothetical protein
VLNAAQVSGDKQPGNKAPVGRVLFSVEEVEEEKEEEEGA